MPVPTCCKLHAHNYICIPIFLGRRGTPDPTGLLVLLLSTMKVSEMQLLSFVCPIIELRTFHVLRISVLSVLRVFLK